MDTSSSKPSTSRLPSKTENPKWHEHPLFRSAAYTVIAAACDGFLAIAVHLSLVVFLFSLVPAVVLGTVFALIQNFDDHARSLGGHVQNVADELGDLSTKASESVDEFHDLVKYAGSILQFYGTLRGLLDDGYQQKDLIRTFLKLAMNGPLFIPSMEDYEFYNLVVAGIKQCSTCRVIHHGPISKLSSLSNLQPEYLQQLRECGQSVIKQRIVILEKNEQNELNDYDKVGHLLAVTKGTESYWADKDEFFRTFDIPPDMRLDDAALYDGKLLLLRQRETKLAMLVFSNHKDRACSGIISAFENLNHDLRLKKIETKTSLFRKIELPSKTNQPMIRLIPKDQRNKHTLS